MSTAGHSFNRFARLQILVGETGLKKLTAASVAVFGLGGVGSYAVEALARSGIRRLTLIDFDDICPTNINRQLHALEGTIGHPKAQVMAERCRAINPHIQVEPIQEFFSHENADRLLDRGYDYVLDCIDSITAKLFLIESCRKKGLAVISSMGAANKLDPTAIKVDDLSRTQKCRLARIIRKELRKRGIENGVKVVYSTEEFRELNNRDANQLERNPTLGSSSFIPPIFGLTMAGEIIRDLLKGSPA
jgi:tRNA A37 threonylcarbamoyladenosine dehydratase